MVDDQLIKSSFAVSTTEPDLMTIVIKEPFSEPEENTRQAELVRDKVMLIVNQNPAKTYNLLLDILNLGGFSYISSGAREIYGDLTKLSQLKKTAVLGSSKFLEIAINLMMESSGKAANFKWFSKLDDASQWLNN